MGRRPNHISSNRILQIATASHKSQFSKPLDHEVSLNSPLPIPCLRTSSESRHTKNLASLQPACCWRDKKENKCVHTVTIPPTPTCKVKAHEVRRDGFVVKPLDQELGDLNFHHSPTRNSLWINHNLSLT